MTHAGAVQPNDRTSFGRFFICDLLHKLFYYLYDSLSLLSCHFNIPQFIKYNIIEYLNICALHS